MLNFQGGILPWKLGKAPVHVEVVQLPAQCHQLAENKEIRYIHYIPVKLGKYTYECVTQVQMGRTWGFGGEVVSALAFHL